MGQNKLLLTLASPHEALAVRKAIESVSLPGTEGVFTVTNSHSQVVSQLQAGPIVVKHEGGKEETFFLSDGFAFISRPRDDSGCCHAEVSGVEVVPADILDKERAQQMLTDLTAGPKETEWDKAKIQLGGNLLQQVMKCAPS